jgi:ABC-type multidrug transport system fused ATPase/permease subunit
MTSDRRSTASPPRSGVVDVRALPPIGADRRWVTLVALVANGLGQAAAAVVAALAVERAFGALTAVDGPPGRTVVGIGAALAAAGVVTAVLRGRERVDAERLGQAYTHRVRVGLFDRLTAMSPRSVQTRSQGGTALRFIGDLSALRRWISLGLARLIVGVTMVTGALVALALLDLRLAAAVAVVVAVGAVSTIVQGPALRDATRDSRRRRAGLAANVNEKIATVGVVQVHGAVDRERRRVRRQSRRLRGAMVDRARRLGRLQALSEGTASAAVAVVLLVGLTGGATPGTVAGAMAIVGLVAPHVRDLGRVQEYWHGAQVAREAIGRFLDRPTMLEEPAAPRPLTLGPGELSFAGVSVTGALDDLTAVATPGTTVAVVGPNGAGKSTLLAVAARLVDTDAGAVRLDGQDLAGVATEDVRRLIGLVSPDLPLLRGSVAHNLRYRDPDASDDELARVAALCDIGALLVDLPDGGDSRVAEGGAGLSSGQRQRLMLARALLGRPSVLLLDEVDANLDAGTSAVVDRVIRAHPGTTLVVTHRRERLAAADVVWHIDGGRLVEVGPPDELLRARGPTARLFGRPLRAAG